MRWDNLFDDLAGQLEYELGSEDVDLRAEEERLRLGRLSLRDRLGSLDKAQGKGSAYRIGLHLSTGPLIHVRPATFGKDWFAGDLVGESRDRPQCIVPYAAIASIELSEGQLAQSLGGQAQHQRSDARLVDRIGLGFVLRDLCRRRTAVELWLTCGRLHGTIDRVGRDHLDLALHERGEPRRSANVTSYRMVPLTSIVLVRV